ncbi:PKD-like domain-containing protein, partial [Flavobacterium sp.]|uniref:PKD-like domain-containing protein n=1 Tax=Flavobacterium sp. TaxID=239 RepID=UPI0038D09FE8
NQAVGQSTISQTLTNLTNTTQTVVYTVTPTSGAAGSCVGPTFTVTVTVNPKPVVLNQTATICSGTVFTIAPVNAAPTTIIPASTTYTWTVAANANVTGQSNQTVGQNDISQTLSNNTNIIQTVVYTVTPTSGDAGTCIGSTFTITVTVNPTPVIPNQTAVICSNGSFNTVLTNGNPNAATIIPTGTTYSWSAPTVTGGVTGGLAGVSQSSIFGTLSNPTALVQTATYTVTATSGAAGSCVASTFDVVVTVNALPIVTIGTIAPVNTMDVQFLIPYTTNFTLTNFSLSANNSAALPSFSAINNANITTSPLVIPLPTSISVGSYNFDLIVTDSNGCISLPTNATLQINLVKVLDKNGQRMVVPANATNQYGARGYGVGRTANGQLISAPLTAKISTNSVSSITSSGAICGGNVISNGGTAITSIGVCWSTSPNPTIANTKTTQTGILGSFTSTLTGLTSGTTYYVRSYATNSSGTSYGNQVSFTTP